MSRPTHDARHDVHLDGHFDLRHDLRHGDRRRHERGAVSIDLVALLPLFLIAIALVVQSVAVVSAIDATNQAARDAARAQSLGQSAHSAARDALPDWVRLNNVAHGACADACLEVEAGVPIGWPGLMTITHVPVTRSAVFVEHD